MNEANEAFIQAIMTDKGITRDEAIERCVGVIRAYAGGKYDPQESKEGIALFNRRGQRLRPVSAAEYVRDVSRLP